MVHQRLLRARVGLQRPAHRGRVWREALGGTRLRARGAQLERFLRQFQGRSHREDPKVLQRVLRVEDFDHGMDRWRSMHRSARHRRRRHRRRGVHQGGRRERAETVVGVWIIPRRPASG